MIGCCIFDLDGTLLNTLKTITYYVNKTLADFGIEPISEDDCRRFIGNGAKHLITSSLQSKGVFDDDLTERVLLAYNIAYNANTSYLTAEYSGITDMLRSLAHRGIKLGVLSNKPDQTTALAVSEFFPDIFNAVHGGREGIRLKPHPDSLLAMIGEMGFSPDNVAYIGDTAVDVQTARAANVALTVGVSWGFRDRSDLQGASVIVDTANELLRIIENA